MRTVLLTALLLTAPAASAQGGTTLATPPAPAAAATVTLSLGARPGTLVELTQTTVTRLTVEDVQVTAPDGAAPSEAEQGELRQGIEEALGRAGTQTSVGKVFYKVQERAPDGTVTLVNTVITQVPGLGPLTVRLVQTVAPGGTVALTRIESDNPLVQAALSGLTPEVLRNQLGGGGGDLTGVYGQTFAVGQPVTRSVTVDVQALLGAVLGSLAAGLGGGENPLGGVQASPLTVTTTTTYRGVNPAALHVFGTRSTSGAWTVEFGGGPDIPRIRLELLGGSQGGGLSLYRPDGLPVGSTQTQATRLRMSLTQPGGEQLQMLVRLDQTVTLRPR
ncbi:hypothetical protein DAETH_31450 [Deinococcus aetherius]|uniref:Uncharacterized protein n=1 Tax=Deinococcus aetherius TaxID=200252 RepID=A0ABN6RLG5_9DEIO|nr:hypothetical protein [Deinococcus aetherius]BDP43176.1 hypothetical protein DAETH_31450 [Deinococcus aetherius]